MKVVKWSELKRGDLVYSTNNRNAGMRQVAVVLDPAAEELIYEDGLQCTGLPRTGKKWRLFLLERPSKGYREWRDGCVEDTHYKLYLTMKGKKAKGSKHADVGAAEAAIRAVYPAAVLKWRLPGDTTWFESPKAVKEYEREMRRLGPEPPEPDPRDYWSKEGIAARKAHQARVTAAIEIEERYIVARVIRKPM